MSSKEGGNNNIVDCGADHVTPTDLFEREKSGGGREAGSKQASSQIGISRAQGISQSQGLQS